MMAYISCKQIMINGVKSNDAAQRYAPLFCCRFLPGDLQIIKKKEYKKSQDGNLEFVFGSRRVSPISLAKKILHDERSTDGKSRFDFVLSVLHYLLRVRFSSGF